MPDVEREPYACGVIPLRCEAGEWQVLLIQHRYGAHWSFPKGHQNRGETAWQTAQRELTEETGLYIDRLLTMTPFCEQYTIAATAQLKTVDYFAALVVGNLITQESEIIASCWLPLQQALDRLTFPEGKRLLSQVIGHLRL
jgi:bis(5'-nucleosidyl)-tetraphosphatase